MDATDRLPADPGLVAVLEKFGVGPAALLGHGGEAWVYALDDHRVLRVMHAGGSVAHAARQRDLVRELSRAPSPFALPDVIEEGEIGGRAYTVDRRLPGRPLIDELRTVDGHLRARLIEAHLDASAAIGRLALEPRGFFGDLLLDDPVTAPTWGEYLRAKASRSLSRSTPELAGVDADALAAPFPEVDAPAYVHLDAFAGNMLTDGTRITAVLDVGATSVAGDARFDPVASAVYLTAPEITPAAQPGDVDVCRSWLQSAGLAGWAPLVRRWLAGFWAFATDDADLFSWCRRVLLGPGGAEHDGRL